LKILYISHLHPPEGKPLESIGGMQNVSMQLVRVLGQREDVELKTIIQQAPWEGIGISTTVFLVNLLGRITEEVRSFKPDVILFSSMVTAGVAPFLPKSVNVPMVTINHGQDVTLPVWPYQRYLPFVFNKLSGVISVSAATREACIERGMNPDIGVALPNGLDTEKLSKLPAHDVARKAIEDHFKIDLKGKKLLLTVGRQVKRKGHTWFINEAMPLLKNDVVYLIIGDGPEFEYIRRARENSPLKENIILAGRQPGKVLDYAYAASDLFIMPNIPVPGDMEGFGIVLLEANSAGLPAVAADLEGIKDVIEQGVNGYRVEHSRPELFAQTIDKVLDSDLNVLSESARKYAVETFGWEKVVDRYINFLSDITFKQHTPG